MFKKLKNILKNNDKQKDLRDEVPEQPKKKPLGLEIKMPGSDKFVPIGRSQYKRIYADDIGPRLICIIDEVAELIEPTGIKTTEGREEDALKQEIVSLVKSITQLGRSSGMHIVLSTQRNDAPIFYNQELNVIKKGISRTIKWSDLRVGDIFEDGSKCVKIGEWLEEPCYELYNKDGGRIIASETHLFKVKIIENNKIVNDCYKYSKIIRGRNNETDESWICVKDIFDAYINGLKIYLDNGSLLDHIQLYQNGKPQKVRCIETDTGHYRINGFLNHNSIIPGVIQNNPLAINTKLRVRRKIK